MTSLEVGIIGSGGRESELARQASLYGDVQHTYILNGNAGTAVLPGAENVPISSTATEDLATFVLEKELDLTIVGPEAPLVAGVADRLRQRGFTVFGPSAAAARLEASKADATLFMEEFGIPHPPTSIATDYQAALKMISGRDPSTYVIKADGLAGGKGVVLPNTSEEAERTLRSMFLEGGYDGAGKSRVLISERFHGPEVSAFAISDGSRFVTLPFSQDHKRLLEADKGPNTGGMGAYAPLPAEMIHSDQEQQIQEIIERSINGMADRGTPYQGVLYVGIMLAEERGGDPVVIEYNVRFGDPETQVVLPVLSQAGVDVFDVLRSSAEGSLSTTVLPANLGNAALTVCLTAPGYPDNPQKGQPIHGLDSCFPDVIVHHGGTRQAGNQVVTSGGRVLYVTGLGPSIDQAAAHAYRAIGDESHLLGFEGMHYRNDIGGQLLGRQV